MCVCVCVCVCLSICLSACERERERVRSFERQMILFLSIFHLCSFFLLEGHVLGNHFMGTST